MQRMVMGLALVAAVVMVAGCKGKNDGMSMGRNQSSSVAYEDPASTDYYAPSGTSTTTYNDGSAEALTGGNRHVVAKGETLYSLARSYYNDQSKWRAIYDANRGSIPDPNKLKVGQELIIP